MNKRGKWINDEKDYMCSCGQLLRNTCQSMIKKHRKTLKHKNYNKTGVKVNKDIVKTEFENKQVTITFD